MRLESVLPMEIWPTGIKVRPEGNGGLGACRWKQRLHRSAWNDRNVVIHGHTCTTFSGADALVPPNSCTNDGRLYARGEGSRGPQGESRH